LRAVKLEPHLLADIVIRSAAIRCRAGRRPGRFPRHVLDLEKEMLVGLDL
jgi:hypothetical protein